jgi:acyl-coenzyme A synthetase/AMP-(fatty) acid ligase/3-hydroxymyristoyl/3-hydroxydecanoyl-(acyl carrier protein) dehydratase
MTKALLSAFTADAPLFVRIRDHAPVAFSACRCAGAIEALAAVLPPARQAIQCCTDTLELALGTLAAWRAGQTVVMPSTRLATDLDRLRQRFPDNHVLDAASFADAVRRAEAGSGRATDDVDEDAAANAVRRAAAPWAGRAMRGADADTDRDRDGDSDGDAAGRLLAFAQPRWPAFSLNPPHEAIVLFTSGSTREPRPQVKTWDALVRGANTFRHAFLPQTRPPLLVGTVDCHHMFGLEANLMASLHCGYALLTDRPRFPGDLADLVVSDASRRFGPIWLVTTPLQLSMFHRAGVAVDGVERVIVATMPLAPALAADVERDWRTRVDEIYGNTECGVMATRRTALRTAYVPAPGMQFRFLADDAATVARVPDAPTLLDDRVSPCPDAGDDAFVLLGRRSDMIKVGGKRTTLRALDDHLFAIAGVVDGAFFAAEGDRDRVCAVVVAPTRTAASLRAELACRVDPAFMPRPLLLAGAMPRDAQGKLARAELVRLAAELARPDARACNATIERSRVFAPSHPAFAGHFPGHPIVPGAMLLAELEGVLDANGYRVVACDNAKFLAAVGPDERCTMRLDCADPRRVTFEVTVADRVSVRGAFRCEPAACAEEPQAP